MFTLGIDATTIQGGGGVTHLVELLAHVDPVQFGFGKVVVWGGKSIEAIEDRDWLSKQFLKDRKLSAVDQLVWRMRDADRECARHSCDLLFAPGGSFSSGSVPYVSMSQNMLLYERDERRRFPLGYTRLRYNLLRFAQNRSFRRAAGIVFISQYARQKICTQFPWVAEKEGRVIYHGISSRFQKNEDSTLPGVPTFLYVSRISYYKHQWKVVEAVEKLNVDGYPCRLLIVGGGQRDPMRKLQEAMVGAENCEHVGEVDYAKIDEFYHSSDAFVFASTCENMPNILVEAMASGLPIACSDYGPMPEILGDAGCYFDPLSVDSIADAIKKILVQPKLRSQLIDRAASRAKAFSWEQCSSETFTFLNQCVPVSQSPVVLG